MSNGTQTYSTGFFAVDTGTAAIDIRLRTLIENFEDEEATAGVRVSRLSDGNVVTIRDEQVTVPGGERRIIDVDPVEGEDVQVTVTLPVREYPPQSQLVASVAIVSIFHGEEEETTLLHWLSGGDFVPVGGAAASE